MSREDDPPDEPDAAAAASGRTWAADYDVPVELARELIHAQFPQLSDGRVALLGEGWDNAVFRVDAAPREPGQTEASAPQLWAFRFARREFALTTLAREVAVLPALAPLLPLPIPRPILVGAPTPTHPRMFWGGPLLPGVELLQAHPPDPIAVAAALGGFLRVLHSPQLLARLDAAAPAARAAIPLDPTTRSDAASVAERGRQRLGAIEVSAALRARVSQLLDRAADLPPLRLDPVLSHGDLHPRHVLLDGEAIGGVIDWGDLCRTDRSVDLSIAFSGFAGEARDALFEAYGPTDEPTALRGRILAAFLCAALAHHAQDTGAQAVSDSALEALARTVT